MICVYSANIYNESLYWMKSEQYETTDQPTILYSEAKIGFVLRFFLFCLCAVEKTAINV